MVNHINIYKRRLYKQITSLLNTEKDPWIIIGELSELLSPNETKKKRTNEGSSTRYTNSIILFKTKVLLI